MSRLKPILRWSGGKSRMLKLLMPLLRPHQCYVEPFAGGLAVLLAKTPSPCEVINDLSGDLVTLYRVAKYHLDALLQELQLTLYSREDLQAYLTQPGLTDVQRSARYLLRNRCSFGGKMTTFAVSKTTGPAGRSTVIEALQLLSRRLDKVLVENLPYERILSLYDSPGTLFFLDPPYLGLPGGTYAAWTAEQVTEFGRRVAALRGSWIVTLNDHPVVRAAFADCQLRPVSTRSGAVNQRTHGGQSFQELIITPARKAAFGALKARREAFVAPPSHLAA